MSTHETILSPKSKNLDNEPTIILLYSITELSLAFLAAFLLNRYLVHVSCKFTTTPLNGPPNKSIVFGLVKTIAKAFDAGALYESWMKKYGPIYRIHGPLLTQRIVICDPKAINHVCNMDTMTYSQTPFSISEFGVIIGLRTIICLQGDDHKVTRRVLNPAFGSSQVKAYLPTFCDAGHKVKRGWNAILQSQNTKEGVIDVSEWMEKVALDVIGVTGFSHNFDSLVGKSSPVFDSFRALSESPPSTLNMAIILLAQVYPMLFNFPLPRSRMSVKLSENMEIISKHLLDRARVEGCEEKSTLGILSNTEQCPLTKADILTQMKSILFAGNETTAVTLKWAVIELAQNPQKQELLRKELAILDHNDPTFDQLSNELPYLDAVVRELLRLHPFGDINRYATQNDRIPLSQPIIAANGKKLGVLSIAAGTTITIPVHCINRSEAIWGEDAKQFIPERWLVKDGIPSKAQEFPGYYHSLTFFDGPRTCLGKLFALIELKAVICILVQNFEISSRDGLETQYGLEPRVVGHPIVAGEEKSRLPMRIVSLHHD